jgi:hypothetical protein
LVHVVAGITRSVAREHGRPALTALPWLARTQAEA